jgi:putative SOS response-associated peptidase YedK
VPATSFCEYAPTTPRKTPTWFAVTENRPLFAFAGLWARWRGVRGPNSAPVEGEYELFGFLTTERPLPDGMLDILARGEKDPAPAIATVSK